MASAGDNHGGNGQTAKEIEAKQNAYVEKRLAGATSAEARASSGLSPTTKRADLERSGGPVFTKIQDAFKERGMDNDWLAEKYEKALAGAQTGGFKDPMAYFKGLLQISWLMGYGKQSPAVAVQINNNTGAIAKDSDDDPERVRDVLLRVEILLGAVKKEVGDRGPGTVHVDDSGAGHTSAHPGVDNPPESGERTSGGGLT